MSHGHAHADREQTYGTTGPCESAAQTYPVPLRAGGAIAPVLKARYGAHSSRRAHQRCRRADRTVVVQRAHAPTRSMGEPSTIAKGTGGAQVLDTSTAPRANRTNRSRYACAPVARWALFASTLTGCVLELQRGGTQCATRAALRRSEESRPAFLTVCLFRSPRLRRRARRTLWRGC